MAVDREFEVVLETWAERGQRERDAQLAAAAYARADRWARLTTHQPYNTQPEGERNAQPAERSA